LTTDREADSSASAIPVAAALNAIRHVCPFVEVQVKYPILLLLLIVPPAAWSQEQAAADAHSVSDYRSEAPQGLQPPTENAAEILDNFRYEKISGQPVSIVSLADATNFNDGATKPEANSDKPAPKSETTPATNADRAALPILPPPSADLLIDAVVNMAIDNHPALQAASAAIDREQNQVFQVTRRPNPTVGYLASEVGNDGQAGQQGMFISQNIVRGGKLCLNGQVRQRDVTIATQQLEVARQQIIADARLAFLDVAYAQEQLKLLQRLQASLDRAVDAVKRLVDSGELSLSSKLQSRLEAERNAMEVRKTRMQLKIAKSKLAALIGRPEILADVAENALLPIDRDINPEEFWLAISNGSPELSLAQCRYDKSHWQVRREEAEPIPDLQTQWSVQHDTSTDFTVVGIQIGVELPIHDNNSGAIGAARSDTWRTQHEIEALRRSLRQRLAMVAGQRQQAAQQLKTIKEELEDLARENLQTTQKAFALGEATYLDLLNAQRAYIRLSLDTLLLYQQLAVAETHLDTFLIRAAE